MKVINGIANFVQQSKPAVLTLGFFDGVHAGHQRLLERLVSIARDKGAAPVVLTFDSHPLRVVSPDRLPPMIMTLTDRMALLESLGVELAIVQPFDEQLCSVTAEDFLHDVLLGKLKASVIVCGHDTHFGRHREGNFTFLKRHAPHDGFHLYDVPPLIMDDQVVSSTIIRRALQQGDFAHAATWLTRPWTIWARVVEGGGIGRTMGYPTANLETRYLVMPPLGIYAAYVHVRATRYRGVMYVGTRPTFPERDTRTPVCEVYIVDFSGEAYNEWLRVQPVQHLRDDRKFGSASELAAHIARDVTHARTLLEHSP